MRPSPETTAPAIQDFATRASPMFDVSTPLRMLNFSRKCPPFGCPLMRELIPDHNEFRARCVDEDVCRSLRRVDTVCGHSSRGFCVSVFSSLATTWFSLM